MDAFTIFMNLTGQPAISLPTYQTAAGLSIGIQLSQPRDGGPPPGSFQAVGKAEFLENQSFVKFSVQIIDKDFSLC